MLRKRERIAIFGAGLAGRRAAQYLRYRFRVIAFLDNDPGKHGQKILGKPVVAPSAIKELNAGKVFIASMHAMRIYPQLVKDLGVEPSRVETVHASILSGEYDVSPWTVAVLSLLAVAGTGLTIALLLWGYGRLAG